MTTSSNDQRRGSQLITTNGPEQADVDALRDLLDLLEPFSSNDQRARYLLTCNWMRDRGAVASQRLRPVILEQLRQDLLLALAAVGVEIRLVPGLTRTAWRPEIGLLKLGTEPSVADLNRELVACLTVAAGRFDEVTRRTDEANR